MITVGHDGEFFLRSGDVIVPSQGIIPGTKHHPHQLDTCMLHRDNTMGEFGTPPATTEDEFVSNIQAALAQISAVLGQRNMGIVFKAHHVFDSQDLMHPEAMTFGCEPDFDCYIQDIGTAPNPIAAGGLRSAGGHAHIGYDFADRSELFDTIKALDLLLGTYSVLHDSDVRRRELYGKAGRFRPKPYGLEYRTLSNFWYNSEDHMRQVFRRCVAAVTHRQELASIMQNPELQAAVVQSINTSDAALAREVIDNANLEDYVNAA